MKLKTRIIVGFVAIILLPLLLFSASLYGFSQTQAKHVQESSSQASDSSQMVYDISLPQSSSSQVKLMAKDMILTATIILVFTALSVGLWIYRSIAVPLVKLKKATKNIKEGNLDFVLEVEGNDEFSQLCQDFEEMRKRLKESTEEKILMEFGDWMNTNKEAIYDTQPWKVFGEGPIANSDIAINAQGFNEGYYTNATAQEIRFTQKGEALYVTALAWPKDKQVVVKSLSQGNDLYPGKISQVELLGYGN